MTDTQLLKEILGTFACFRDNLGYAYEIDLEDAIDNKEIYDQLLKRYKEFYPQERFI
jgi:hypothetical protein